MYVKRSLGAESLARIFANLSRRGGGADRGGVVRLPRPPETTGKRRVA
jgi:hypothetical protein